MEKQTLEERNIGVYSPSFLMDDLAGFESTAAWDIPESWAFKCEILHMTRFPSCGEIESILKKHITTTKNYDKLTDLKIIGTEVNNSITYNIEYVFSSEVKYDEVTIYTY